MPKFETMPMAEDEASEDQTAELFEDLAKEIQQSQEQLESLPIEAEKSKDGVLDTLENQIILMRKLGVSENILGAFETDLNELRGESKSWWTRLTGLKDKLMEKVKSLLSKKQGEHA